MNIKRVTRRGFNLSSLVLYYTFITVTILFTHHYYYILVVKPHISGVNHTTFEHSMLLGPVIINFSHNKTDFKELMLLTHNKSIKVKKKNKKNK